MVGVWCATSATGIIGPVFPETTNSHTYVQIILTPFSENQSDYNWTYIISQYNSAAANKVNTSMFLKPVFDAGIV